jgi:hypothetical protein
VYVPAGQRVHELAEAAEYVPGPHTSHADASVFAWNVPAAQFEQTAAPEAEYVPTVQYAQVDESGAPVAPEKVPAGQAEQIKAP